MTVLHRYLRLALLTILFVGSTPALLPAAAPEPYEINAILSLTGFAAFLGHDSAVALGLIEAATNKDGGIRGRPIKFVIADDHSNPQVALQLANALIARNVPLFLGPTLSGQCGAVLPVIAEKGPVMYCFSPSIRPDAGSYGFVAGPSIPDYIFATVRYLRERGWTKIALLTSLDATGQDGDRSVRAALTAPENKAVSLVDSEHFNITDISVTAQMAHINESGAQAAIFWTSGTPFGTLLHGASDAGLKIPIATTSANLNYNQLASYASFMPPELYMMTPPFAAADALPAGGVKRQIARYLSLLQAANLKPAQGHVTAWDGTLLVIDALKHLGTDATADQIRGYLSGVSGWSGVSGIYDFKKIPQRGVGSDWLYMLRWNPATQSVSVVSRAGGYPSH